MTLEFVEKWVTTGHVDHKIAPLLKFDDLCANLAIVSLVGDAEYTLGEGVCLIGFGILGLGSLDFYL